MKILVFNAGSSSLKYHLYLMSEGKPLAKGNIDRIGRNDSVLSYSHGEEKKELSTSVRKHKEGVALILKLLIDKSDGVIKDLSEIDAAGHRIVHGGAKYASDVLIDDNVIASLDNLLDLAPLHNLPGINCIQAARKLLPDIPQAACFDTVFHKTIPPAAYTYGLPYELCEKYHIRRYGFHGLSHEYVSEKAAEFLNIPKDKLNAITCHLGNGCSITAIKDGQSIDTSMGFTPLEGLIMGTRCGDIDTEIIFYLMDKGRDYKDLARLLNKESGLVGISGVSNDMRTLLDLANKEHEQAQLAIDVFTYRVKKYIGAYFAVLENIDALVFTGGIGENSAQIRRQICNGLKHMGIELDESQNNSAVNKEACISTSTSRVKALVVPTNEEIVIATKTRGLTKNG